MKPPSTDDKHVPVRAYLTDETFGYEHWRAAQFSAPDAEVQRWAILSLYPTKDVRDTALSSLLGGAAPLPNRAEICKEAFTYGHKHALQMALFALKRAELPRADSVRVRAVEEVQRLLEELHAGAAPLQTQWQPIETCPKMRTVLLFAVTDVAEDGRVRNWKMATGSWCTGYDDDASRERGMTPWHWDGRQVRTYEIQPTHWQPLPSPPEEERT